MYGGAAITKEDAFGGKIARGGLFRAPAATKFTLAVNTIAIDVV
jgi:hypothetical protein